MEKMDIFKDIDRSANDKIDGIIWWKVEGARIAKEKGFDIKGQIYKCKSQDEVNNLIYTYMKEGE